MKISNKIFACVLTVCMLLTMFAGVLSANAADGDTATIGSVEIAAGETATVPVTLNAAAIGGADLYIDFSELPEDVTVSAVVAEGYELDYLATEGAAKLTDGVAHFVLLASDDAFAGANNVVVTLTVAATFEAGKTYAIAFAEGTLIGTVGEVEIAAKLTDGAITVAAEAACQHPETKDDVIKEATCGEAGSKNIVCAVCDEVLTPDVEIPATGKHNFVNNECTVCKAPYGEAVVDTELVYAAKPSVVYGTASIEMAFRVANTVLAKYADVKMVIIPQKYDTTTLNLVENPAEIVIDQKDLVAAGSTRKQYYFTDLMLYELGLDVDYLLRAYDANGNLVAVSETFTTSVAEYLKTNILASSDAKYKTMATDTLIVCDTVMKNVAVNYPNSDLAKATSVIDGFDISAASQTVGEYNDVDVFNSYNADFTQASSAKHQIRSSVQVEKVAFINFRIADQNKVLDLNKLVVKVSYTSKDSAGEHPYSKEFTGTGAFTYAGKYINLKFDQVGIHDSNKDILFEVTYDGVAMCDWTYSVDTYLGANQEASNGTMIVALLKLGQSFRAYQNL